MKHLSEAIRNAPPALTKPGEQLGVTVKLFFARRRMRRHGITHLCNGGGRVLETGLASAKVTP